MSSYVGTFVFYNSWAKNVFALARPDDSFAMLLCSGLYVPDKTMHSLLNDINGEVSGNGYARQTLGAVTFNEASGVASFDFGSPQFVASSGPWTARYWVVYDVSAVGSPLIAYGEIDENGADVTVTEGNSIRFDPDPMAFFEIAVL